MTWRAAGSGRRWASATTWRISPMETDAPLRRTMWRSGSVPASAAAARGADAAPAVRAEQGGREAVGRRQTRRSPVRPEQVGVHRVCRGGPQRGHRVVLATTPAKSAGAGRSSLTGRIAGASRTVRARPPRYAP